MQRRSGDPLGPAYLAAGIIGLAAGAVSLLPPGSAAPLSDWLPHFTRFKAMCSIMSGAGILAAAWYRCL